MVHGESDIGSDVYLEYLEFADWGRVVSVALEYREETFYVTQKPGVVPGYRNILYPLDLSTWLALGVSVAAATLCFSIMAKCYGLGKAQVNDINM